MKNNSTISVAISTFNEEKNIQKCLDAVTTWVDEIILYDAQSQDDTVSLAKKYKNIIIISGKNFPIFHKNKQIAIDACTSDWILQLDADEIVTPQLKIEIQKLLSQKSDEIEYAGFWIKRKNYFLGKFLTKGGVYPDPTIRLYKRGQGRLPCVSVHEQTKIDGKLSWLKADLLHYSDPNFSRYILRNDRYTTLIAQELIEKKISLNLFNFVNYYFIKPIFRFFQIYFRHLGFVDAFPGFVFAFYSSLVYPLAYTKLWEHKNTHENN